MTELLAPNDALAESLRLIAALERRRDLPFADDILAVHRPTHTVLERSSVTSDNAVAAWRAALARRWECEVAGRRLYKQVVRQLSEYYGGAGAPEVQLLSRGGAEADSSPVELLHDLRRMQAALEMGIPALPAVSARIAAVARIAAALEAAIAEARHCEEQRRAAALDRRMAQEAYRRARIATHRALLEYYDGQLVDELAEIFVS